MPVANTRVTQILLKRGNTAVSQTYVGPLGEVTIDTDLDTLRIHDGQQPGGFLITAQGGGGNYSDANVAALLSTFTGNIQAGNLTVTPGNISLGGSTLSVSGGNLYVDGSLIQGQGLNVVVDISAPSPVEQGQLWWDTESGTLYIRYANAWIEATPSTSNDVVSISESLAALSANFISAVNSLSSQIATNSAQMTSADNSLSNAISVVSAAQLSTWNRVSAILTSSTTFSGATYTFSGNIAGNTNGFTIGYLNIPQVTFNANSTLALTDAGKHYYSTSSGNLTMTIPNNSSTSFAIGSAVNLINQGTGTVTVAQGSGVTLYFAGNSTAANRTVTSYGVATVQKVATDTWFIVGVGIT